MSGKDKFSELDATDLIKALLSASADINQKQAESAADFLKHLEFDARGVPMKDHSLVVREMLIDARMEGWNEGWNEGILIELRSNIAQLFENSWNCFETTFESDSRRARCRKVKKLDTDCNPIGICGSLYQ